MTGFVFFESFYEMLQEMPEEMSSRFYRYICEYGLYGQEPQGLKGLEKALWIPIKVSIDSMQGKSKRGRPRKQAETQMPNPEPPQPDIQETLPVEDVEESTVENEKEVAEESKSKPKRQVFKKPTVEEVGEFIKQNNLTVNAEQFWNWYEANGWKTGRNPMKNWQAAVRTWEHNKYSRSNNEKPKMADDDIEQYVGLLEWKPKELNGL